MATDKRGVPVSREDKVFFPDAGVTKGEMAEYYHQVAQVMVPHLQGRSLTLRRFPDGIGGEGFFQKEASEHFPEWVDTVDIARKEGGTRRYVVCSDGASLVYLADQATIEFHIWPSRIEAPDNPDRMVIDIDPPNGSDVGELRSIARRLRDLFSDIGLTPFLQATGGKGYHVVCPLDCSADYDTVRGLARDLADELARQDWTRLTTAHRKEKRGGRIFLDTNRNGYAQTFIAPYSVRAREGAPVAAPLDWDELGRSEPNGWNLTRMRRRLAHKVDPWARMPEYAAAAERARTRLGALTGTHAPG